MTDPANAAAEPGPAAGVALAIARNVSARRRARGLSLDALARRAGVSKGMLVAIEAGRGNPSIGTLCRVAAGLGAAVADLVEAVDRRPVVTVAPGAAPVLWRGPHGGEGRLLVGAADPLTLELWRWELRPGERHAGEAHPPGARELLYVESGALALHVEDETHAVPAGGAVAFLADRPHAYASAGAETLRLTMVVAEPEPPS